MVLNFKIKCGKQTYDYTTKTGELEDEKEKAFYNIVGLIKLNMDRDGTLTIDDKNIGKSFQIKSRSIESIECVDLNKRFEFKIE